MAQAQRSFLFLELCNGTRWSQRSRSGYIRVLQIQEHHMRAIFFFQLHVSPVTIRLGSTEDNHGRIANGHYLLLAHQSIPVQPKPLPTPFLNISQ